MAQRGVGCLDLDRRLTMSLGVLIAVGSVDFEPNVLNVAEADDIYVVRRCVDVADLLATAASRQAHAALVSAHLRGLDTEIVARLRDSGLAVIGVTADALSADEALLLRLGITRVAPSDDVSTLAEAIREAVHDPMTADHRVGASTPLDVSLQDNEEPTRPGTILAVWGPTGAPGRSVVSLGLSAELARAGAATLLIDADVYGGSIAPMLGLLDESSGLLAAARSANVGALGAAELAAHARQIDDNLTVLTGLPRADRWTEVRPVLLSSILTVARRAQEFTVVDCGFNLEFDEEISYDTAAPRRNGATVEALEQADQIIVVGAADPVGLGRLIRGVSDVMTAVPSAVPHLVVNRFRSGLGWSSQEVLDMVVRSTGIDSVRLLPDDPSACDAALVHGRTLSEAAPGAPLSRALSVLAADLAGVPTASRGRRPWFKRG